MDDLDSIYTDVIMEHSTATYNKHKLQDCYLHCNGGVKKSYKLTVN